MTYRVLVAVDGTQASNTALEIACALADNYDANLGLLCVIEPDQVNDKLIDGAIVEGVLRRPDYRTWYHAYSQSPNAYAIGREAERARYVDRLSSMIAEGVVAEAQAYSKESSAKAVKTFVRSGDPADEIVAVAKETDADIIIMGHDRVGRLESLIKGSVAEKVVREAHCPCLVFCLPKKR